jgi:hypothetical protein
MWAGGGHTGVGVDPAFYRVTSAGPVPAGGTVILEVNGTWLHRDMSFRSHLRSGPGHTALGAGPTGGFHTPVVSDAKRYFGAKACDDDA